jgi:hypothetical protein
MTLALSADILFGCYCRCRCRNAVTGILIDGIRGLSSDSLINEAYDALFSMLRGTRVVCCLFLERKIGGKKEKYIYQWLSLFRIVYFFVK